MCVCVNIAFLNVLDLDAGVAVFTYPTFRLESNAACDVDGFELSSATALVQFHGVPRSEDGSYGCDE